MCLLCRYISSRFINDVCRRFIDRFGNDGKNDNKSNSPSIESHEDDWTLNEAIKTRSFWAILICVGIPAMVNTGITFHIASIFDTNGLSLEVASLVLSLMALVGIPISFVLSFVLEKVKI
ncbi:hypothetical protein [Gracilibacillus ureilyticus]|nr:hypothetical protein [Gracilibacillus ureilyticus]